VIWSPMEFTSPVNATYRELTARTQPDNNQFPGKMTDARVNLAVLLGAVRALLRILLVIKSAEAA
jgi:hypothetical protein